MNLFPPSCSFDLVKDLVHTVPLHSDSFKIRFEAILTTLRKAAISIMAVCTFTEKQRWKNMHSCKVGNYWTISPSSEIFELPGYYNPENVKDEAVICEVWIPLVRHPLRLCYRHTLYQRPYISLLCLTLTIVSRGLEWRLLTPELTSWKGTDC